MTQPVCSPISFAPWIANDDEEFGNFGAYQTRQLDRSGDRSAIHQFKSWAFPMDSLDT